MSKIIATRAIKGAHKLVNRAEKDLTEAIQDKGASVVSIGKTTD